MLLETLLLLSSIQIKVQAMEVKVVNCEGRTAGRNIAVSFAQFYIFRDIKPL